MADLDAEKDLRDNRFSYLLQPIRDLAANWDINIAGELEEYLEELEHLTFTIEGCGPALNFAEAALLIQGTTCVFSKKVEYLHSLVYQALETIFNKKQKERQAAANRNKAVHGGDAGLLGADGLDGPEAFLSLGSQLELAQRADIDLADDEETALPELLRPPTALLALEDAASGQGGPGSAQAGARGEAGSYRLAQCAVHVSGALLLEARDGQLFDAWLRPVRAGSARGAGDTSSMYAYSQGGFALDGASMLGSGLGGLPIGSQCTQQQLGPAAEDGLNGAAASDASMLGADEYDAAAEHEGYGGDDDAFPAFDGDAATAAAAAAASDEEMADAQHQQQHQLDEGAPDWLTQPGGQAAEADEVGAAAAAQAAVEGDGTAGEADGAAARVRQQRGRRGYQAAGADGAGVAGGYYDPYTPLNPAEPGSLPNKPLQVRKPKRRTNAAATQQLDAAAGASVTCLNASHHPQLAWPEFGYILDRLAAAAAASRVSSRRRGDQQQLGSMAVGPQPTAVMDWKDAAAAEEHEQAALLLEGGDADAGTGDYGGDGYEDDGTDGFPAGADLLGGASLLEAAAEAEAGGLRPWAAMAGSGRADGFPGAGDSSGEPSYEELCRSHIESLIAAAAAQQVQSELAVRVSSWRSRIDPILAAEEDRSAFDIHDYGSKILTRLQDTKQQPGDAAGAEEAAAKEAAEQQQLNDAAGGEPAIVDFKQVAGASDSFEVCRLFAAMLQLVNNRNINLIKQADPSQDGPSSSSSGGSTCSSLQLQLLTVARVHEAMAEGLAGGATQEQGGMLQDGMLREAPPPRSKPAPKKPKPSKKAAAAADAAGSKQAGANGGKAGKGKAAGGGKGAGSSSEDDGGDDVSDITDSDEEGPAGQAPAAAGKGSRARSSGRSAAGTAGKAAAVAAEDSDSGAGGGSSDNEFDAEAENLGVHAAAGKGAGKVGKPPAKKPKRTARAVLA